MIKHKSQSTKTAQLTEIHLKNLIWYEIAVRRMFKYVFFPKVSYGKPTVPRSDAHVAGIYTTLEINILLVVYSLLLRSLRTDSRESSYLTIGHSSGCHASVTRLARHQVLGSHLGVITARVETVTRHSCYMEHCGVRSQLARSRLRSDG